MKWMVGVAILYLILTFGCDQGEKMSVSTEQPRSIEDKLFIVTGSGLKYYDIKSGSGEIAKSGNLVSVHYTGWLTDGKRFDSSVLRQKPFSFPIGQGRVIAGWDKGVAGMQIGGIRQLVIPPELGYGESGAGGVIPPGATLIFEVELLEISN
jgi:FKBP-type peptidyl-prolyl cis-trans isomerase